jgi:outer membrane protein assembly factor BamD (BamD/ComL family)
VYRGSVSDGYDPFKVPPGKKPVTYQEAKKGPVEQKVDEQETQLRSKIAQLINQKNLPAAANLYLELTEMDSGALLTKRYQLDMANQLMSMGKWKESASAYEKFLSHYKSYEYAEQVQLMLGILYSRYLDSPDKAVEYLKAAKEKLTDSGQIKMCEAELDKIQS